MVTADVVGVYAFEAPEPVHLVEVTVRDSPGFEIGDFTQETPGQPRENWQAPWDERVLNEEGTDALADYFEITPDLLEGDVRLAFFLHDLDPSRPLVTPFGSAEIPQPSELPERLSFIQYEEP